MARNIDQCYTYIRINDNIKIIIVIIDKNNTTNKPNVDHSLQGDNNQSNVDIYKHNQTNYKLYNINIDIIEVVVRGDS